MSPIRRIVLIGLLGLTPAVSLAESDTVERAPVRHSLGGGPGFIGLAHVDYSRGLRDGWRFEAGLTPLLLLNVGVVGATRYWTVGTDPTAEYNVLLSGTVGGIVAIIDGTPAFGPGSRVGFERVSEHVGLSVAAGGLLVFGPELEQTFLPDARLTVSKVWR
jgi:hypothetical protein